MRRVLHIEIYDGYGGIESLLMSVYRKINRENLQFDFVTSCNKIEYETEINSLGGRVFHVSYGKNYFFKLKQIIVNGKYDIVHIHKNSAANVIPFLAAKSAKVKHIICHSHNTKPSKGKASKVLHYVNRPILNALSDYKFACSDLAGKWLYGEKIFNSGKTIYIKNGIDTEKFRYNPENRKKIREGLGIEEGTLVIGNVGKLSEQKNQKFLIDVFCEIRKKFSNSVLIICGDGEKKEELKNYALTKTIPDNAFYIIKTSIVNEYLQAMDVFVMPSLYEGLSIAMVEAQCAGLPIVVSNKVSKLSKLSSKYIELDLNQSADEWADKILNIEAEPRDCGFHNVKKSGFDIFETARELEDFYLTI